MATERPAADPSTPRHGSGAQDERAGSPARGRGRPPHPDILTPAEWRVLDLLREGLSNPEIAERLALSRDTVKTHVAAILAKLGVASREAAAAWEPAREPAEAGKPRLRRWWGGVAGWLRPVTVGKAALIGAAVAVVAGMGVLAWGALRESGDEQQGRIAFVSTRDGDYDVWVVNEDGSGLKQLTDFGVNPQISNLAWSDDGRYLVFNELETVYVTDDDAGKTWPVTTNEESASPLGFEPGGHRILVSVDGATLSMGLHGEQRLVVADELPKLVSSQGDRLVVSRQGSARRYLGSQLFIIQAGSDERVQLAPELGVADSPAWSPDGSLVAFTCAQSANAAFPDAPTPDPGDIGGICTIRPDGSGLTEVAHAAMGPQWSPDGNWLLYLRPWTLYIARPNGAEERRLTDCDCQESSAAWWQPPTDRSSINATPTPSPYLSTEQAAIDLVMEQLANGGESPSPELFDISVEQMLAGEAAERRSPLRGFPRIRPDDYYCPPFASCPYPGVPADQRGWVIIVSGLGEYAPTADLTRLIAWVGEGTGITYTFRP